MRPTVEEQLQGTCRILETVVAPCVTDHFARTILDNLVANLRMLTGALSATAGFLCDDNAATLRLLAVLSPALTPTLATRIAVALGEQEPDVVDGSANEARNRQLRGLLAEAVCNSDLTPEMHRLIVQHMIDRARRVPMRYVPTVPATDPHAAKS